MLSVTGSSSFFGTSDVPSQNGNSGQRESIDDGSEDPGIAAQEEDKSVTKSPMSAMPL